MPNQREITSFPAKPYAIQIGTYTSLRKAALIRSILNDFANTRVERMNENSHDQAKETLYRVLVGEFTTLEEASHFIKAYRLSDLFKGAWVNPIVIHANATQSNSFEFVSPEILDKDPYVVQIDLHCADGRRYGSYKTELHPDEKDTNQDVDINVHWNCIPEPAERWLAKDEERNPSNLSVGLLAGAGSLSLSDNTIGTTSRTDFSYGIQVGAFKSLGGMGPSFEYRLIDHRYFGSSNTISPQFYLAHRFLVGARLPISHRIEFQPLLGFYTEAFLQGASDSLATLVDPILTQAAIRGTFHLIELDQQAWFDLIGTYHYLFPATTSQFTIASGYEYSFKVQTSSFFPDHLGVNWFFEFSSRTVPTASFTQTDTLVVFGVTALIGY